MTIRQFLLRPIDDLAAGIDACFRRDRRRRTAVVVVVSAALTWWVYVPIHELLHVLGCVITGGTVTELQIDPKYGAAILAKVFPFVTPGGDYAGRLSGFDTGGSDVVYLATDFMPFVLSVIVGVPLMIRVATTGRAWVFGIAVVLGLAPITNLPGDYYEMASILTTRAAATAGVMDTETLEALRSDDVFRLVGELSDDTPSGVAPYVVALTALPVAILLALSTYHAGIWFAVRARIARPPT
jgi:hypothetical protein